MFSLGINVEDTDKHNLGFLPFEKLLVEFAKMGDMRQFSNVTI